MDWQTMIQNIDANTAQAFVRAARHVIDALLIEAGRVRATQTPAPREYNNAATLPRETPAGGWLSHDELRETARQMTEAIAAEKWAEGLLCALRTLALMGGVL